MQRNTVRRKELPQVKIAWVWLEAIEEGHPRTVFIVNNLYPNPEGRERGIWL